MRLDLLLFVVGLILCLAYLFVPSVRKSVFEFLDLYFIAPLFEIIGYFPYVLVVLLVVGVLGAFIFPPNSSPIGKFFDNAIEEIFRTIGNLTFDIFLFFIIFTLLIVTFAVLDINGFKPGLLQEYELQGVTVLILFFASRIVMFILGIEDAAKDAMLSGPPFGAG